MAAFDYPAKPWSAGDTFTQNGRKLRYDGTVWKIVPADSADYGLTGDAQCVFERVSDTQCKLNPRGGNRIQINGSIEEIPSGGVALSNSSLSVDTTYWVYAYMNGTAMALEASTTANATDTASGNVGVEIKTGDSTRTLVGMARLITLNSEAAFQDNATHRYTLTWFGKSRKLASYKSTSAISTTATFDSSADDDGFGTIGSTLHWLDWGLEPPVFSLTAVQSNVGQFDFSYIRIRPDGSHSDSTALLAATARYGHYGRYYNASMSGNLSGKVFTAGAHYIDMYACKTGTRTLNLSGETAAAGPGFAVEFNG